VVRRLKEDAGEVSVSLYVLATMRDLASDLHVAKSRLSALLDAGGDDSSIQAVYVKISEAASLVDDLVEANRRTK
jgi:hypothetical protein